jgi:hypothetical protein
MKIRWLFFLLAPVLAAAAPAVAQEPAVVAAGSGGLGSGIGSERTFGVGLYLGEPVAVSAKWWMSPEIALTFLAGGWVHPYRGTIGGVDFTYHLRDLLPKVQPLELGVYFGAGVGAGAWLDDSNSLHTHDGPWPHSHRHDLWEPLLYVRPVIGGAIWFRGAPLELSVDIAPAILFLPEIDFEIGGGMSARYYF